MVTLDPSFVNLIGQSNTRSSLIGGMPKQFGRFSFARRYHPYRRPGRPRPVYTGPSPILNMNRAQRVGRGRVRVMTRRKTRLTGGTLGGTNADQRFVYRKTNMPRRKKKRWVSFVRKVNAAAEKELGSRTVLFNDSITLGSTTSGNQCCLTLGLYTKFNNSRGWLNDLNAIQAFENVGDQTAAAGETVDPSTKFIFHSAIMDLTIRNISTFQPAADGVRNLDGAAAIELDLYEVQVRKDNSDQTTIYNSLSSMLNAYDTKQIGGAGVGISITDRGASPWEMTSGLSNFGIKILSKTKYFIPNGQTITHQTRDPGRRVYVKSQLESFDDYADKNTKLYFIIYKLVPGLTVGSTLGTYQHNLVVGTTRKYLYKIEGMNESRERYITNAYTPGNPS